jgi:hypothetical protein
MLLSKLLEANVPKYSKKEGSGTNINIGLQRNNMPRADSYEAWLEMKQATLAVREDVPALPAPVVPEVLTGQYVVQDADYEEVEQPLKGLGGLGL